MVDIPKANCVRCGANLNSRRDRFCGPDCEAAATWPAGKMLAAIERGAEALADCTPEEDAGAFDDEGSLRVALRLAWAKLTREEAAEVYADLRRQFGAAWDDAIEEMEE